MLEAKQAEGSAKDLNTQCGERGIRVYSSARSTEVIEGGRGGRIIMTGLDNDDKPKEVRYGMKITVRYCRMDVGVRSNLKGSPQPPTLTN